MSDDREHDQDPVDIPDDPPWATSKREREEAEDRDRSGEPDDEPDGQAGEGRPGGGSLAELQARDVPPPPRPPRRTGIFLDADDLRTHVGELLRTILGGYQVDAYGNYTFTHEEARIFVTVGPTPIGPQVGVFSITNVGVELTPPLAGFLLTTNHRMGFGSFSYDPENEAVWLRHTLLGTTLDGPELQAAVMAVASTAAQVDEQIRDRFGGRAFHDAPPDEQDRARPPDPSESGFQPNASGYL